MSLATWYLEIKTVHVAFAVTSIALFLLRFGWSLTRPQRLTAMWVRTVPHMNDTLLLACGIFLIAATEQYPLQQAWLTAKLAALLMYIVLGSFALKRARSRTGKWLSAVLGILAFAYMATAALTKDALPGIGA